MLMVSPSEWAYSNSFLTPVTWVMSHVDVDILFAIFFDAQGYDTTSDVAVLEVQSQENRLVD